jgi:Reverse transcriptase (RNA-dependent DNA polymerase)
MNSHDKEIDRQVDTLGTWHYERARANYRPIPYTFTYKHKTEYLGQPDTYKARCAIRGDLVRPGIDFDATRRAAHTLSQSAKRLLYADAARSNLHIESWDVPGAYFRADAVPNFRQTMKQPIRSDGTGIPPGE